MKYVIQVATTDAKPVTAELVIVTKFHQQFSDGSADCPWYVKGDDNLSLVHQGTAWGEKDGITTPINIKLLGISPDAKSHTGIYILEMFNWMGHPNSSGTGTLYAGWSKTGKNQVLNWTKIGSWYW